MKKLLVTGASGFLGDHVLHLQHSKWKIIGTYFDNDQFASKNGFMQLDLSKPHLISKRLTDIRPDAILHLAACSQPNFCALNESYSHVVNVESTQALCQFAKQMNIPFLFTSTDLVFSGEAAPYSESAICDPVNSYGKQKVEAEEMISAIYPDAIIARMPLLYGIARSKANFTENWLKQFQKDEKIKAFADEYRTSVSGTAAAKGLFLLLNKEVSGIWHLGGKERFSRYDFAMQLADAFGFEAENLVTKSYQAEVKMPAARPPDVSLDSNKAFNLGYSPPSIEEELARIKANL